MVNDALHPLAPRRRIVAVSQDGSILERDIQLVIEAVGHPAADLLRGGAPFVHGDVERMVNVIVTALVAQGLLERCAAHWFSWHTALPKD